jgi:hypothetical protein
VPSALDRAAELRDQARWRGAQAVLDQARQGLGDGGPADLRQRLDVAEAELKLVNRLDAIRHRAATWVEGHFDHQTAAREYEAAFQEAGLVHVGDDEEGVAARVRRSGVTGPLLAALDDWAAAAESAARMERVESPSLSWLLGVARRAAPDPWGDRFREPAVWRDRPALRALAEGALRDDGAKLGDLAPQVLAALGALLGDDPQAVPRLRAAHRRYPNDFWLSLNMGNALRAGLHQSNRRPDDAAQQGDDQGASPWSRPSDDSIAESGAVG